MISNVGKVHAGRDAHGPGKGNRTDITDFQRSADSTPPHRLEKTYGILQAVS
jgi:hypothetical protein